MAKLLLRAVFYRKILGAVNVRIQKTAKSSAMVVHVDKIKMCKGETPDS